MHRPPQLLTVTVLCLVACSQCIHHMQRTPPPLSRRQDNDPSGGHTTPLIIINQCQDDIYPAVGTQHGTGPTTNGFKLQPGERTNLTVSEDWQGRVWGRANCSFNQDGAPASGGYKACGSGDCNGQLNCKVGGDTPVTLAEFTLNAGDGQTYYDISLVDGYNLPMAMVLAPHGSSSLDEIPPNLTNPSCVATFGLLADQDFDPYTNADDYFLGTNSSFKLPLDIKVDNAQVDTWCPWNCMAQTPKAPEDGVYTYPDNNIQRPAFNPCFSSCAKFNKPEDCCQGEYNSPSKCTPSEYSKSAKAVCPDAYSYAFDDQTSTFIIPGGAGFQIIFCPGGRSTNILTAEAQTVNDASHGQVSFGGGGNGDNSDNKAARDCNNLPVEAQRGLRGLEQTGRIWERGPLGDLEGFHVLDMVRKGLHKRDWMTERWTQKAGKRRSAATAVSPGELGGTTWWLMGVGLFITAGIFVML